MLGMSQLSSLPPERHPVIVMGMRDAGLSGICTFIFERSDDFPEILEFVRDTDRQYKLHVEELSGDFKSGLSALLLRKPIKAVIIGTRR